MEVDKSAFEYAISKIDDGHVFEVFAKEFLAAVMGYEFVPVGGIKDKGVDGYQHLFSRKGREKQIFQVSTELDHVGKIDSTIAKLKKNAIQFSRLVYTTNRKINNAEELIDRVDDETGIQLQIFDIRWLSTRANESNKTIRAYQSFVDTYLHEYSRPGQYQTVANLDNDSRLYVFLAQQFDNSRKDLNLEALLADTLILFALEGTDPDKKQFKTQDEIKAAAAKYLKFDPNLLEEKIIERLQVLTTKPRRVKYHAKGNGYCLPYETRIEIEQRNLQDEVLFRNFYSQTETIIKKYFSDCSVKVKDVEDLIRRVFNKIFSQQGLEFSNFVIQGDGQSIIEQDLNDVISRAVDESQVVLANKEKVKTALHLAIREIVYNGTAEQRRFLKSLSNTYLMMFLLQLEPKLSTYFQSLAAKLQVFVDNSVLVPALSEFYLPQGNRRHWNLLVGAKKAGIAMFINETLLDELVGHLKMIRNKYYSYFHDVEDFYLNEESELLYIDEILIRAYFYAKIKGQVDRFDQFIDNFVDPELKLVKEDLVVYLQDEFGIKFITNETMNIQVDDAEKARLSEELSAKKTSDIKAMNDAEMMLAIYALRKKNNESSSSGIFGYKTWWLSKDTSTYKAVVKCFGPDKYPVSCYIRPDFLYNYIALKPTKEEIDEAYDEIFPTMLGVNLSYHMPKDISEAVQKNIKSYRDKSPVRVKQILRSLSDRLKSDPSLRTQKSVELYLDKELKKLSSINSDH